MATELLIGYLKKPSIRKSDNMDIKLLIKRDENRLLYWKDQHVPYDRGPKSIGNYVWFLDERYFKLIFNLCTKKSTTTTVLTL
jgi:hypothetical protein